MKSYYIIYESRNSHEWIGLDLSKFDTQSNQNFIGWWGLCNFIYKPDPIKPTDYKRVRSS